MAIASGVLLVGLFIWHIGIGEVVDQLEQLGPASLLVLLPYAFGTAISAFPWARLLVNVRPPSALGIVISRFAASGANALVPLLGVAGEPSRLLWLPRVGRAEGLAAIVIDRLLYNVAGGMVLLSGAVVAFTTSLPRLICVLAAALGGVLILVPLLLLALLSRRGIGKLGRRLLRRGSGSADPDGAFAVQVDAAARGLLAQPPRRLLSALLLHIGARFVLTLEVYVALWSLHAPTSFRDAVALATVPIATAFVAFAIPNQIGVQEGTQALICAALGQSPALGLVLTLLQRLRQLAFVPLTPFLIALARPPGAENPARSSHQYGT